MQWRGWPRVARPGEATCFFTLRSLSYRVFVSPIQGVFCIIAPKMEALHNILLIDANGQSAQEIQGFLKVSAYAFSISHALGLQEGVSYLNDKKPEIILLDAGVLNDANFKQFKQLAERKNIPIILLSDVKAGEIRAQAEQAGAVDYLAKTDINLFQLQKVILNTLKINEDESKLDATFSQFNAKQASLY